MLESVHAATLLVAAARRAGTLVGLDYDPTEPRDTGGRWTKGGGELSSPGEAVYDILSGKRASVAEADVRSFLKKSLKQAAPVDLTKLRVEGHLIYGGNGLGIAREDMPQVPKDMRQQFLDEAKDHGITYRNENVDPFSLYPTQKEISAQQVALKLQKHERDPGRQFAPILVSKDNYILDGHHHWGVMATVRLDEPKVRIPVRRLSVGVRAALKEMHAFDERHGIRREAIKAAMEWALRNAEFDESQHPRDYTGRFTSSLGDSLKDPGAMSFEEFSKPASLPPIPAEHVRLVHVTDAKNVSSILEHGLKRDKSRGSSYGEPAVVWATSMGEQWGGTLTSDSRAIIFDVPKSQASNAGTLWQMGDVSPDKIVAVDRAGFSDVSTGSLTVRQERETPDPDERRLYWEEYRKRFRDAADFDESQHPRDDAGKFTDGTGEALTPEQQFEKDKRDYLTPGEFAKLPPGILKWKIAKRKAEAEAKAKAGGGKEVKPPEPEVKPVGPTITERERAISERASELTKAEAGVPWHSALEKARQEDAEKHGPMPANTLRERLQAISDRQSEIRQANPGMSWDEAHTLAQKEDVEKHGPWLEPDQYKERAALIEFDKNWSVKTEIEKKLEVGANKQIAPRPTIDPKERTPKQQAFEATAMSVAKEMGHDPNLIVVRDYEGRKFELNGQTLIEGGHYSPFSGLIELNAAKNIDRGTVIHEIQHAQFDYVKGRAEMERLALYDRWRREQAIDFQGSTRYFTKDGKVMTKYAKEVEAQTPHLALLARAGLGSRELRIKPDFEGMRADDGVSDYSKEYWIQVDKKGGKPRDQGNYMHELAVNETLSEALRRQLSHNYDSDAKFGFTTPARFKKLGEKITELYKQNPEHVRRHFARKFR